MNKQRLHGFLLLLLLVSITVIASRETIMTRTLGYWATDMTLDLQNYNLMLGSSTIERMNSDYLAPCGRWLNRGIGNSSISELSTYLSYSRLNIRPQHVLIYAGENELSRGANVADTFATYQALLSSIQVKYPIAQLHIVGIKPSPKRKNSWASFKDLNRELERYAVKHDRVHYYAPLSETNEESLMQFFYADGIHLSTLGYLNFTLRITQACRGR